MKADPTPAPPPTFLDCCPAVADTIRLFIIFVGITLALYGIKIAVDLFRDGPEKRDRAWGGIAFACFVATPAISGIFNFHRGLNPFVTGPYVLGLVAGIIATGFRFRIRKNKRTANTR